MCGMCYYCTTVSTGEGKVAAVCGGVEGWGGYGDGGVFVNMCVYVWVCVCMCGAGVCVCIIYHFGFI